MSGVSFGFASQVEPWVWAVTFKYHTYTHAQNTQNRCFTTDCWTMRKNGRVSLPTDLDYWKRSFPSPPETWVWEGRILVLGFGQARLWRRGRGTMETICSTRVPSVQGFLEKETPHQRFKGSDCGKTEGETSRGRVGHLSSHPSRCNCWTTLCTLRLWQWCGWFMNFCFLTSRQYV